MEPHLNTSVVYESTRYSIYWTSSAAEHVAANYTDPVHRVTHTEIVQLLKRARYKVPIQQETGRPNFFVFLTSRAGKVWETYVYLVPPLNGWPARCVIVTCYQSNKQQYRALFAV